jgi:hypothetical protein
MLSSDGVVNLVSVPVSVWTHSLPSSLLLKQLDLEARVGIEPTMRLLQSPALPLGYPAMGWWNDIGARVLGKLKFAATRAG